MKEFIEKMNPGSRKSLAIMLTMAAGFLFIIGGCMETTQPDDTDNRTLSVRAYQVNTAGGDRIPLRNVEVQLVPLNEENPVPMQAFTNDQGLASFNVTVPVFGSNYDVFATYNSLTQSKTNILICRDTLVVFIFDTTTVDNVDCGNLDGADTLVFIDDQGSSLLRQNTPDGINRYERCWNLTNSLSNTNDITVNIPNIPDPFRIESILVDGVPVSGSQVTLPPGSTLTICFSVSTEQAGIFEQTIDLGMTCLTNQGTYRLTLQAEVVEPACDCEELPDSYTITFPDRLTVGSSGEHEEVVLSNELPCTIILTQDSFDGNGNWTVLSPNFPQTLDPGESLTLRVRFTPTSAAAQGGTLNLTIDPQGGQNTCDFTVELEGEGCSNSCPLISTDNLLFEVFGTETIVDTLSDRNDNRVFVSSGDELLARSSTVIRTYYVENPDTACQSIDVRINPQFADNYAQQYFEISPRILTLAPGETGSIQVTFTAPTLSEFQSITAARGNTGALADSLFKVVLQLTSPGCSQTIDDNAVVTVFPDISPIINLRAYNQRTPQKQIPENEVYSFGAQSRTINKGPNGENGEYPPLRGHIWIDVDNNDPAANPPQEPILNVTSSNIEMKLWQNGYSEDDFANVPQLVTEFSSDPNYDTGYSSDPIRGLNVGDVIAFRLGSGVYALVFIRRVDNGTENTSSRQSGIEFRSVYPIYIP